MPDITIANEGPTIAKFNVKIKGTIEDVWREITRTDGKPIPAFFNSVMHAKSLTPGSKIAMRTPDGKYTGVVGEITEFDPPKRFAHTFKFTNYNDPECVVVYDLESVSDGVSFTLTIRDIPVNTKTAKQMLMGGKMIVGTLKSVIETGKPSTGTRMLFVMFKVMGLFTPKKCLSEHWPV
ncbi:MAG: SRPBCC domain-containing protein [Phycisphaeraceae bacterium]|nr:SRPBCC domain-containing protein [Phycisphaerales bacterium]MCB9859391.1 SRPBCC domain-containing protein [Phycisphaeraceae bacterium]